MMTKNTWARYLLLLTSLILPSQVLGAEPDGLSSVGEEQRKIFERVAVPVATLQEAMRLPVGQVIEFVDPQTGLRRDPTESEVNALMERARSAPHEGHLPPMQSIKYANGQVRAKVPPEYMMKSTIHIDQDGVRSHGHEAHQGGAQ